MAGGSKPCRYRTKLTESNQFKTFVVNTKFFDVNVIDILNIEKKKLYSMNPLILIETVMIITLSGRFPHR